jgi:hypothetical protein
MIELKYALIFLDLHVHFISTHDPLGHVTVKLRNNNINNSGLCLIRRSSAAGVETPTTDFIYSD